MTDHNLGEPADTSHPDDGIPDLQAEPEHAEKLPQIDKWKVEGTEGLPDEVRTTPIPTEGNGNGF